MDRPPHLQARGRVVAGRRSAAALGWAVAALVLAVPARIAAAPDSATPTPDGAEAPRVEFWTIDANEGLSAGGHAAIRIGETVFHVEHRGDGLLRDRRDDRRRFEAAYRGRGNRGIDVLALALPPSRTRSLESRLRHRAIARNLELDALDATRASLEWVEGAIESGRMAFEIPGLGLFAPESGGGRRTPQPRLAPEAAPGLAPRLAQALDRARAEQTAALARWTDASDEEAGLRQRDLVDAVVTTTALETIAAARPLAAGHLRRLPLAPVFDTEARALWEEIEAQLRRDRDRLIESRRSDRGLALLLVQARLAAARAALARSDWWMLDAFAEEREEAPDSDSKPGAEARSRSLPAAWQAAREQEAATNLHRAIARLRSERSAPGLERRLDGLERAAHTARHVLDGTAHRRPMPRGALTVSRAAERPSRTIHIEAHRTSGLERQRRALREEEERLAATLRESQRYDLFQRNCVTELLSVLEAEALLPDRPPHHALFAPARAHPWIRAHAPIQDDTRRESSRRRALANARAEAGTRRSPRVERLVLPLRESNTLSSRLYRPHDGDSAFLFFAADIPLPFRPLAGVTNLAWGFGASATGLLLAPFDEGTLLRRGLQGIALSAPELVFLPIRKGSYAVTPPGAILGLDGPTD